MDKLKLFLDGKIAIITYQEQEFELVKTFLSMNNIFLENGEPVSKMKSLNDTQIIFTKDNIVHQKLLHEVNESMLNRCIKFDSVRIDLMGTTGKHFISNDAPNTSSDSEPIEADVEVKEEVVNQVENEVAIPELKADVEVATIKSNIEEFKAVAIPKIKNRANLVITRENIKFAKEEIANLNKNKKLMREDCNSLKKKILSNFEEYNKEVKEIESVIDEVVSKMKTSINTFEEEDLKARKEEKMSYIKVTLSQAVEKGLPKEFADKFICNEKWWTNKSYKASLFKDEVKKELDRLAQEYAKIVQGRSSVQQFIKVQCASAGIGELDPNTYIKLLESGTDIADVMNAITRDIQNVQLNIERAKNKALEEQKAKEQQFIKEQQNIQPQANKPVSTPFEVNQSSESGLNVQIEPTPEQFKGNKYAYTFGIQGDFGVIKTVSNFLKELEQHGLKYTKISGGKLNG